MNIEVLTKEDIRNLEEEINSLMAYMKLFEIKLPLPTTVSVKDACLMLGVSRYAITGRQAYLLPYFGKRSDFPDGPMRWKMTTWIEWNKRPIENRKIQYEQFLKNGKEQDFGIVG